MNKIGKFNIIPLIIYSFIWIFLLGFILSWFYIVQPWQVAFEKRLWTIDDNVVWQGLYFKIPIITNAIKYNVKNIVITDKKVSSSSRDLQDVFTDVAVNFSLRKSKVVDLYSTVWDENDIEEKLIRKATQDSIKSATAQYTATDLIIKREEVSQLIIKLLKDKLDKRWIDINQVDILNFEFSKDFNRSIEAKVKAEQEALKAKAQVQTAKAVAESVVAKARWEADAKILKAEAEAKAIQIQAKAIQVQWWADYIKLKYIEKWDWKLPQTTLWNSQWLILNLK